MPAEASYAHAYHFDAGLYAALLRKRAEAAGVVRQEGRVAHVDQDAQSGDIRTLTLADGRRVEADFFIDCSGFSGVLIDKTLKSGFEDWSHWLPCDRAVVAPATNAGPRPATPLPPRARPGGNGASPCSTARAMATSMPAALPMTSAPPTCSWRTCPERRWPIRV
jgi:glycine/D-amino acid oxidase-like deaminating enzyme